MASSTKLSGRKLQPYPSHTTAVQGRKVWISGATKGLGFVFAKALLLHGCSSLAVVDICSIGEGENAVKKLAQIASIPESSVAFFQCDVRDKQRIEETMRFAAERFGGLDTVVNNAGVADEQELEKTISVNLIALITATEAALSRLSMEKLRQSHHEDVMIVNICSAGGIFSMPVAPYYSASKHGVLGYTKSMRDKCVENGVRINCFCPGWVDTGMGSAVKRNGNAARFTGIMRDSTVVETFLELFRRRDLYGEAVYISQVAGARVYRPDISSRLNELRRSNL